MCTYVYICFLFTCMCMHILSIEVCVCVCMHVLELEQISLPFFNFILFSMLNVKQEVKLNEALSKMLQCFSY